MGQLRLDRPAAEGEPRLGTAVEGGVDVLVIARKRPAQVALLIGALGLGNRTVVISSTKNAAPSAPEIWRSRRGSPIDAPSLWPTRMHLPLRGVAPRGAARLLRCVIERARGRTDPARTSGANTRTRRSRCVRRAVPKSATGRRSRAPCSSTGRRSRPRPMPGGSMVRPEMVSEVHGLTLMARPCNTRPPSLEGEGRSPQRSGGERGGVNGAQRRLFSILALRAAHPTPARASRSPTLPLQGRVGACC
jgi:hypothetical protein